MRTKFTVSITAAASVLAGVAVPMTASESAYTSRSDVSATVERQLTAASLGTKRPLIARAEELNDKESV
jgi:hypothetical protein